LSELLVQDAKDNESDNLSEAWAKPMPIFPVEDGFVSGELIDEHSKFNLNSVLKTDGTVNEPAKKFFQNMLKRLQLDENLVDAVIDWQDHDEETVGANQMFNTIEQLQLVRGFAGEPYQKLKPYITALPKRDTKINVNTSSAFILSCLHEQLQTLAVEDALKQQRENLQNFANFSEVWNVAPFSGVEAGQRTAFSDVFDVKSAFFSSNVTVSLSERQRNMRSWLYRSGDKVQSYQRSWVLVGQAVQPSMPE
jgi:general secretion pathway protein K